MAFKLVRTCGITLLASPDVDGFGEVFDFSWFFECHMLQLSSRSANRSKCGNRLLPRQRSISNDSMPGFSFLSLLT